MVRNYLFLVLTVLCCLAACEEGPVGTPELPPNPFDDIDYGTDFIGASDIDSSSILGLHKFIFSQTCAVPGCHDGHFEPDFRTVQSTYNTLVYHPVEKNDAENTFKYRVLPGDPDMSWLHERVTTDDPVLGRMPLYDTLSNHEIDMIRKWIADGALDVFGDGPNTINFQPSVDGWLAFENDTNGFRLDTLRENPISPMTLLPGKEVEFWFLISDVATNGDPLPGHGLTYNKIRFSDHPYDFESAPFYDMEIEQAANPFYGPLFFSQVSHELPYYHHFKINTDNFVRGRQYFVRLYFQDADHDSPTEWPNPGTTNQLISTMSFIVS